jgi:hypothetical protein
VFQLLPRASAHEDAHCLEIIETVLRFERSYAETSPMLMWPPGMTHNRHISQTLPADERPTP